VAWTGVDVKGVGADKAGAVWLAGEFPAYTSESRGRLLRWNGSTLREVYVVEEKNSTLCDVDFAGGVGWAVGGYVEGNISEPVLLRYENGNWARVRDIPFSGSPFFAITVLEPDLFWVVASGSIYKYDAGNWSPAYELPEVNGVAAGPSGLVVAWPTADFIWVFNGKNWVKEFVDLPPGFSLAGITGVSVTEGAVYLIGVVFNGPYDFNAIISRDLSPAGAGAYELSFYAPHGPYVYYQNCIAFRDEKNGLTLGPQTHIICEEGIFYEGLLPIEVGSPEGVVCSEEGKYWMYSLHEGGTYYLYYLNSYKPL